MNLFIAGIGQPQEIRSRVRSCLIGMCDAYPYADKETVYNAGDSAFVAGIHTATKAITPRRYLYEVDNEVLLYDGVAIDTSGTFKAYDAEQLAHHWTSLPSVLEGQFCVVRVLGTPGCIEVLVDSLGMYQLYYITMPNGMLLSNSIELINRITGSFSLDTIGASYYLGMGWAAGNTTLRDGVRVVMPGEVWRWQADRPDAIRKPYYSLGDLGRVEKNHFDASQVESLANELSNICVGLEDFGVEIECPITAGRDSRLLTALMNHNSIEAKYFTAGPHSSHDMAAGKEISQLLNLTHKVGDPEEEGTDGILRNWGVASERLLRQTDGMVTLEHIGNAMHPQHVSHRNIELFGAAGEIARPVYFPNEPLYYMSECEPDIFVERMIKRMMGSRESLLKEDVRECVRKYLGEFAKKFSDSGFATTDLEAVFYTDEGVRRWAGANVRTITSYTDVYVPLATRPYVAAALALPGYQRYSEKIPRTLIHYLAPELDEVPMQIPWHAQTRLGQLFEYLVSRSQKTLPVRAIRKLHRVATGIGPTSKGAEPWQGAAKDHQRSELLESKLDEYRSICFDQAGSGLWQLVDREKLEEFLSPKKSATDRRRHKKALYKIFTLFQYTSSEFQASNYVPLDTGDSHT